MTKLKYNALPEVGTTNAVAEPRVGTCFKELETFLNGNNLDGAENIKAEGIKESNLEKALQEKLATKIGLTVEKKNESFVAEGEKFYAEEKNGATVTTPAAVISKMFGVYCYAASCKIKAATGVFFGDFITTNPTELTLTEKQHVILQCDGTNWGIIAGEPKNEAKWTGGTAASGTPSATRPALVAVSSVGAKGTGEYFLRMKIEGATVATAVLIQSEASHVQATLGPFRVPANVEWSAEVVGGAATTYAQLLL